MSNSFSILVEDNVTSVLDEHAVIERAVKRTESRLKEKKSGIEKKEKKKKYKLESSLKNIP